jgi:hypothetical protein
MNGGVSIIILIIGQVKHGWTKSHHTNTKGMLENAKAARKKYLAMLYKKLKH